MKILLIAFLCPIVLLIQAQTQLDVLGDPSSIDPVVKIKVGYSGLADVVGLSVYSETAPNKGTGGYFFGGNYGVIGESPDHYGVYGTSSTSFGVYGYSEKNHGVQGFSRESYGVNGESDSTYGVYGFSPRVGGVSGVSTGGDGVSGSSITRYGVSGFSDSDAGVYGQSDTHHGVVGRTFGSSGFDFYAQNPIAARNYGSASSRRWKRDIINIPNALEKLSQLRGVYFNWDEDHGGEHSVGFIAEEVGLVLPEVVVYEENGVDAIGMDYSKMTPLLVEAANAMRREYEAQFHQIHTQLDSLREEIERLNQLLSEVKLSQKMVDKQSSRY